MGNNSGTEFVLNKDCGACLQNQVRVRVPTKDGNCTCYDVSTLLIRDDDPNKCPDDTAGARFLYPNNNRYLCMCTHYGVPKYRNSECGRKTVPGGNNTSSFAVYMKGNNTNDIQNIDSLGTSLGHILQITLLFTLVLVCFVAIIFVGFCIIRRRSFKCLSRFNARTRMEMKSAVSGRLLPDRFINNPTYETTCLDLSIRMYTRSEINLLAQVGQGCFGKVYKGEVMGEIVAVKLVRSEHSAEALREIETMACFSHPNILPLLGIVKAIEADDSPWLLFEFMEHGDLASVLRNSSSGQFLECGPPRSALTSSDSSKDEIKTEEEKYPPLQLTHELLTNIAMQIAAGMKYLSFQHFVHRDLAARNCLVSASGLVKISDFGLSRDVYTCDYYKIGGSKLLPIRWMAPESILYGRFTLESDVWAYGTVLWEIYTWGKQPYYGHSNEEVVQLILDGVLLCPPSDSPSLIQEIMAGCWKTESKDRFNFSQICEKFAKAGYSVGHSDFENEYESPKQIVKEDLLHSTSPFMMSIPESEYEIPRPANEIEYLQVV